MKTVSNLQDSVAALLSGIDINQVSNLNGAFERAARVFVQKAKIPESQGTQNIMLYSGVTDYLIDTRIFGTSVQDIRPQGFTRSVNNFVYKKNSQDFDMSKDFQPNGTMCTFDYSNGTPIIRIVTSNTPPQIPLDTMSSLTGWTYNASVTDLMADQTFFWQTPASMRFNLAVSGSQGYFEKTTSPVDLTAYKGVGVGFLAIELPTTGFTSFELRLGSNSSNYYTVSNTTGTLGFTTGQFMLVAFDLSLATTVLSPDISKISYIRVALNYNGTAQTNVRLGGLFISLPSPHQILYSSAGIFLVGSTVSTSITTAADQIILSDPAYTIYEYECALQVLQQQGGATADSMVAKIDGILNSSYTRTGKLMITGLYDLYKSENPSEVLRATGSYYDSSPSPWGGQF